MNTNAILRNKRPPLPSFPHWEVTDLLASLDKRSERAVAKESMPC
jgi:hypothetical protein